MKTNRKIGFLVVAFLLILTYSCRRIIIVDSSAEIVSRSTDTALNDSALIYGTVVMNTTDKMPYPYADIWIEGTEIKTTSDVYGEFSLNILPGMYTVKSLAPYSEERFMMTLKDISLSPNEKVEILFSHGFIVE